MKKFIIFATAGVIACFLVVPAMVSAGNAAQKDSAVGGFQGVGSVNNVDVSAYSDANGANPYGHVNQTIAPSKGTARSDRFDVTCLEVNGNFAKIGLTASNATTAANFPDGRVLLIVDNGSPVHGQPADTYGYFNGTNDCTLPLTPASNLPANGNILVNDQP